MAWEYKYCVQRYVHYKDKSRWSYCYKGDSFWKAFNVALWEKFINKRKVKMTWR